MLTLDCCSAAASYTLAEQLAGVVELRGLQAAARMGRKQGGSLLRCLVMNRAN